MVFDSRDNAKDVLLNSTLQANTGAVSSFDKSDFYKFQVNGSSSAFISLNALSADANLILSTASGQQLAASTLTGRTSEAISANLTAGTYYIQVVQNSGNTTYNLSLSSNNIFANIGDGDTNYIRGSSIKSYNNNRLDFQDDGNLVVYNSQAHMEQMLTVSPCRQMAIWFSMLGIKVYGQVIQQAIPEADWLSKKMEMWLFIEQMAKLLSILEHGEETLLHLRHLVNG
jgi:Bacterial pre-peptidase C-terminal domain